MPTPIDANTVYDDTHTWQNVNDRVSAERVMLRSPQEEALMSMARSVADPSMPDDLIRDNMTVPGPPDRYGYQDLRAVPPGIDYMFGGMPDPRSLNAKPTDFSGTPAGMQSSELPAMPIW